MYLLSIINKQILKYYLLFMVLRAIPAIAQNQDSYYPIPDGEKQVFFWQNLYYEEYSIQDTIINDITYSQVVQHYTDDFYDTLLLRSNGSDLLDFDKYNNVEYVRCPLIPIVGARWTVDEKNTSYHVAGIDRQLITPYASYDSLLQINYTVSMEGMSSFFSFYYKKGIGYVGATDLNGVLLSFRMPSEATLPVFPARTIGCNDRTDYTSSAYCTLNQLYIECINNLDKDSLPAKNTTKQDITLMLHVVATGEIGAIYSLSSYQDTKAMEKRLIQAIRKTDDLLPAIDSDLKSAEHFYIMIFNADDPID